MKTGLRRLTAMVLAVSMVTSMVGIIPAFAANTSSAKQIAKTDGSYAYYQVDENRTTTTLQEGEVGSTDASKLVEDNDSDATIQLSKEIAPTNTENQFKITLTVTTTDDLEELDISPDAAVVMVMDTSGSMEDNVNINGTTTSRMAAAKTAAKAFISDFAEDAYGAKRMVSIVDFDSLAEIDMEWVNVASTNQMNYSYFYATGNQQNNNYIDTGRTVSATGTALEYAWDVIDYSLYAGGGTNIEQGLDHANDLITKVAYNAAIAGIKSVYVVLLTDGQPTFYHSNASGLGNDTNAATITATNATAATLRENAMVYAMAFGVGDDECYSSSTSITSSEYNTAKKAANSNRDTFTYNGYEYSYSRSWGSFYYTKSKTVTIGQWLSADVATSGEGMYINATDGDTLTLGFDKIVDRIQQLASAWQVTDPMGQHITLVANSITGSNNTSIKGNTITWNLRNDSPSKSGDSYTYTMGYTINLDTDASTFLEDTYYLTNGQTTLKYVFVEDATDLTEQDIIGSVDFLVPAVQGEYPIYNYQVNYYLQTGVTADGTILYGDAQKESYSDTIQKYDTTTAKNQSYENYTLVTSEADYIDVKITTKGQSIDLYYVKDTTTATVNHHYYTVTTVNDTVAVTEGTAQEVYENLVYVGENYLAKTAVPTGYFMVEAAPTAEGNYKAIDTASESIKLVAQVKGDDNQDTKNIVNYYYVTTVESYSPFTVDVTHEYVTYGYEINEATGRYEEVIKSTTTTEMNQETLKYGDKFTATKAETDNFKFVEVKESSGSFDGLSIGKLTEDSAITLTYEYHPANPNALADVTVEHIYEAEKTYIDPETGATKTVTVTESAGDDSTTATYDDYRAGETFTATEVKSYNGNNYTVSSTSPSLSIEVSATGENKIVIKYTRSYSTLETTDVEVYHTYTLIQEVIDEETGKVTEVKTVSEPQPVTPSDTFYVDQFFTASQVNEYSGKNYKMTTDEEALTIQLGDSGTNKVYINYELKEELGDAKVTVTHTYYTYTGTYVDGSWVETLTDTDYGTSVVYEGSDGERYTATEVLEHDGEDYVRMDKNSLTVTLDENYPDQTLALSYKRVVNDLTAAGVTVNHYYTETITEVVDGAVKTYDIRSSTLGDLITSTEALGTLYAGMSYTATEVPDGFTPVASNDTNLVLVAGDNNVINLYYTKSSQDLTPTTVQVIHHYTTYTTNLVGDEAVETKSTNSVPETVISGKYVGEYFTATADPDGFTQRTDAADYTDYVLQTGENVIDIYYEISYNYTSGATLDVTHIYTTEYAVKDDLVEYGYDTQVSSYATVKRTFNTETYENLFAITNIESANTSVDKTDHTIVLEAGENAITIEYYRYVDDRTPINVTVNHVYTTNYVYEGTEVEDGRTTGTHQTYLENVNFSTGYIYDYTIVADPEDADAEDVTYTYNYDSGEATIELIKDGENVITIYYVREVDNTPEPTPTPSTTYYTLTVSYVDEDGNEIADGSSSRKAKGNSYSTTEKSIDGYTFLEMHEDSDAASGTMNKSKDVIYVYTADVTVDIPEEDIPLIDTPETPEAPELPLVDIPEEDVPLADTPETEVEIPETDVPLVEIPAEDVPLSDIPQTGDNRNLAFLVTIASLSAMGLAILVKVELDDKKKRASK